MKRYQVQILCLITSLSILSSNQVLGIENVTVWSSKLEPKSYHWKVESMNLNKLNISEQYFDTRLIGAANMEGGDVEILVQSLPDSNFNFFTGDRLKIHIFVEGDAGVMHVDYNSDYNLIILPLTMNDTDFFNLMLENIDYLENLTQSNYLDHHELDNLFTMSFSHKNTFSVNYTWNIETGFLEKKIVLAGSGNKIVVVPGKGKVFSIGNGYNFNIIQIGLVLSILSIIVILVKKSIDR